MVQAGFNHSKTKRTTNSDSFSESLQQMQQQSDAKTVSKGNVNTVSDSTQVSIENRIIKSMLDKIERNIERIDECEGYGAFNVGTYILADNKETALNAAGNFVSLMKGDTSSAQVSAINCWEKKDEKSVFDKMLDWLKNLSNPRFRVTQVMGNTKMFVTPAMMLSGPELTVQV